MLCMQDTVIRSQHNILKDNNRHMVTLFLDDRYALSNTPCINEF